MSRKILIHTDEEPTRESIRQILSDHHDLILCDSSQMSLEVINNADIETVILKLQDQGCALDFIKKLKQASPSLKIIVVVSQVEDNLVNAAKKMNVYSCITKPFKSDELLAIC